MTKANSVCVALDTPEVAKATALARELSPHVGYAKIGMEFFYTHGAHGYEQVAAAGLPIFLDLKLHDIPNTVAAAMKSLMRLFPKPAIINVHASGGLDMMKAAREAVGSSSKLIAVTILTSLSNEDIWAAGFNPALATDQQALKLAELTAKAGLDGVVCSPHDLAGIRSAIGKDFLTVVPGIRPEAGATHDQKRVATPRQARHAGADILVVGRAITDAAHPAAAAEHIAKDLAHG